MTPAESPTDRIAKLGITLPEPAPAGVYRAAIRTGTGTVGSSQSHHHPAGGGGCDDDTRRHRCKDHYCDCDSYC